MDQEQVLAERRLRMERDGVVGLQDVALQIGFPQWSKGEAVCAIAIAGLEDDMPPTRGRDVFDVLVKAARALRQYCRTLPAGIQLFLLASHPTIATPMRATHRIPSLSPTTRSNSRTCIARAGSCW